MFYMKYQFLNGKILGSQVSWCPKTLVTIPNIFKMEKNLENCICMS